MSKTVFVKLFGLLVTFSKGLLRNHTAADGTVDVVVKRDPLEFVLNKQCQSNIDCVSSASFLMIVCPDAVSVAADTVAIQPLFSCGIVQNLPLPNTLKDKQKYIGCSSFALKDSLTNRFRNENKCFKSGTADPLWKVPFTPGVFALSDLFAHIWSDVLWLIQKLLNV